MAAVQTSKTDETRQEKTRLLYKQQAKLGPNKS